ncbi:hypothetical protein [Novosphingobium sp. 9]|uniref:hypothetical protein n=1 Tax=Novosphingobium sp. 9 TaxID=2025349 RepID=UPI0021B675F4|nr:hypothetical protein [Novosphingobium sp. 9]
MKRAAIKRTGAQTFRERREMDRDERAYRKWVDGLPVHSPLHAAPTFDLIAELTRRGEWKAAA